MPATPLSNQHFTFLRAIVYLRHFSSYINARKICHSAHLGCFFDGGNSHVSAVASHQEALGTSGTLVSNANGGKGHAFWHLGFPMFFKAPDMVYKLWFQLVDVDFHISPLKIEIWKKKLTTDPGRSVSSESLNLPGISKELGPWPMSPTFKFEENVLIVNGKGFPSTSAGRTAGNGEFSSLTSLNLLMPVPAARKAGEMSNLRSFKMIYFRCVYLGNGDL